MRLIFDLLLVGVSMMFFLVLVMVRVVFLCMVFSGLGLVDMILIWV